MLAPGRLPQPIFNRWTERAYHNLIYFSEAERDGLFAAWEEPQLLSEELRAAFRELR